MHPIAFSDTEAPASLAAFGVDDVNLFVDDTGRWEAGLYVQLHPVPPDHIANWPNDQLAVVIDRAAESLSEHPGGVLLRRRAGTGRTESTGCLSRTV